MRKLFVSGIGTGVGKTISSAILVEKLKADYWKPIQSGDLDSSDTMKVRSLVSSPQVKFYEEKYRLSKPLSPHRAAELDGISISLQELAAPVTDLDLIIEGAGGLMVPINRKDLMIDLVEHFGAEVILVSQNYLGSINHTLLSAEILKSRGIPLKALIFCGPENMASESYIEERLALKAIRIPQFEKIDKDVVKAFAAGMDLPF